MRVFEVLEPRTLLSVSPGPIASWQLDELSGTTAFDSAGGYNAAYVNSPTLGKTGAAYDTGTAVAFNGTNQDVSIGNPSALNFAGPITIAAWIKPLSASGVQAIIEHGDPASPGAAYLALRLNNGSYQIVSSSGGTAYSASSPIVSTDWNTWVHLAGVYNGTSWTLYRNGVQAALTTSPFGAVATSGNWTIAASGPGTGQFFQGNMQDVAIYPRALAANEVSQLAEVDTPTIPFAPALAAAALVQNPMTAGIPGSMILGNGDLNGILWVNGGQLQFQILKNDVADGVLNTAGDTALPRINLSTGTWTGTVNETSKPSWSNNYNPCPVVMGSVSFNLGGSTLRSTLNIQNATATVAATGGSTLSAMVLQGQNVAEFDTSGTVSLTGCSVSYIPSNNTSSGTTNGIQWTTTTIPGNSDVPTMSYAMAMAVSGTRHVLAAVSSFESADPLAAAQQLASNVLATSLAQVQAAQTAAWAHFWAKSGVQLANTSLQTQWYRNLYYSACASRPGAQPIQLCLGTNDINYGSLWHGMETTDYNMQQSYWGSYAAGHPELSEPYTQYYLGYQPVAQWLAQNLWGLSGAAYPHNQWVNECTNPAASALNNHGLLVYPPWSLSLGLGGWILQDVWNSYSYNPDPHYLSTVVYPLMKEAAIFYAGALNACPKNASGQANYGPSVVEELGSFGAYNVTSDISFTQLTLQAAIQAAQTLGVDSSLVTGWQQALTLLPAFPTATGTSGTVITGCRGWGASVAYNVAVPVLPVYPAGVVNWFSSSAQKAVFLNTIQTVNWGRANSVVMMAGAYARLAPVQTAYNWIASAFSQFQQANGLLIFNYTQGANFTEGFAASGVISEMLLQSVGGTVRFFPAMPASQNASFTNLGAQGGFTVSGSQQNGTVGAITVTASQAADFKFLSPWQYVCATINGQTVALTNNGDGVYTIPASAWSTASTEGMQAVISQYVPTVVAPTVDSYVRGGSLANANYGNDTVLWVKNDPSAIGDRIAYLRFDLSGLTDSVQSALLTLTPAYRGSGAAGMTIAAQLVGDSGDNWAAGGLTWNNRPSGTGLTTTISGSQIQIGVPIQVDVTALVNQAINANGLATFQLSATSPASIYQYVEFASQENTRAAWRPTLVVIPGASAASAATIDGATVIVADSASLATPMNSLVVQNGGAVDLAQSTQTVGTVTLANGTISNGALIASAYEVQSGTISANLGGAAALVKSGPGTVVLSGVNSFLGSVRVLGGTMLITSATAIPDGGSLTIGSGGAFVFDPMAFDNPQASSAIAIAGAAIAASATPLAATASLTGEASVTASCDATTSSPLAVSPGTAIENAPATTSWFTIRHGAGDTGTKVGLVGPSGNSVSPYLAAAKASPAQPVSDRVWFAAVTRIWNRSQGNNTDDPVKKHAIELLALSAASQT